VNIAEIFKLSEEIVIDILPQFSIIKMPAQAKTSAGQAHSNDKMHACVLIVHRIIIKP